MEAGPEGMVSRVVARRWRGAAIGAVLATGAASAVVHLVAGVIAGFEGRLAHVDVVGVAVWTIGPLVGVGAVLYVWRRRPNHPLLPWFTLMAGVNGLSVLLGAAPDLFIAAATDGVVAIAVVTATTLANTVSLVAFLHLMPTFPDGRFLRRSERMVARWSWVALAQVPLLAFFVPIVPFPAYLGFGRIDNPWYAGVGVDLATAEAIQGLVFGSVLVGVGMLATRYRHLGPWERRRTRWLVLPLVVLVMGTIGEVLLSTAVGQEPLGITFSIQPALLFVGVALGLVGPGGTDVDRVLRRSVVYGVLWLAVAAVYIGTSAAVGVVAGNRLPVEWAILLTIVATMVFQPARAWLERLVDRWVFGRRADPTRMIAHLGEALAGGLDLATVLPRMEATLEEGLGLEWASVRLEPEASDRPAGDREPALRVPIEHEGAIIGVVECGTKVAGSLTDEDRLVVETLARQAALTVGSVRLARELVVRARQLEESRTRLVKAQQLERRRIERNIHDGVQQDLVGLMAMVGALRQDHPAVPTDDLIAVQDGLTRLLSDLRELAAGIHPSTLTDLGLLASVEALANRSPIPTTVRADERMQDDDLPEEVAGVAYFTVAEALTNCAKHATANEVEVTLERIDGLLHVTVSDDGRGFDAALLAQGQGLTNLVERVAAVDGALDISSRPGEGTVVAASIAVPMTADAGTHHG